MKCVICSLDKPVDDFYPLGVCEECVGTQAEAGRSLRERLIIFLAQLEKLKQASRGRENDLLREEGLRQYSQATADAYAFVQIMLKKILEDTDVYHKLP